MLCMLIYAQKHTLMYPAVQTCAVLQARAHRPVRDAARVAAAVLRSPAVAWHAVARSRETLVFSV